MTRDAPTDLFGDDQVDLEALRERAFNLRWATLPPDVIPLTAADPDFPVAPEIRESVQSYVGRGVLSYGPAEGLPSFKNTVARVLAEQRHLDTSPARILPTNSTARAMFIVAREALSPGDEAVVFDPVDFLFAAAAEAAGATVVRCPLDATTGRVDPDRLRACMTPRTRLIGVCNPHNPLGHVLEPDELWAIGELANEFDLTILSDEIWSDITYPGHQHVSIAALTPELARRTVLVHGFSKSFGLAGLRIGFLAAPSDARFERLIEASGARTTADGVSTVSQIAAEAAWDRCWYWVEAFRAHLTRQRDLAVSRLNAMPGVTCRVPEGTYVVFPDISALGIPANDLTVHLLEHHRVAVVPGDPRWFGPGAAGHIRLCLATSRGLLTEALDRIDRGIQAL